MKYVISTVSDFPDGTRRVVEVNGKSVGVFRLGDRFFALRNRCPHQFGPLCLGALAPRALSDQPGQFAVADGVPLLACPWHGWEYDIETGQSFMGPDRRNTAARRFDVAIVTGEELVTGESAEATPDRYGRVPGPYRAETVPIYVEEDYVVIDD